MKVVRSGDLVSYTAEEGVRILGEGKFLVSDSFPGNERTKYCLTSKVYTFSFFFFFSLLPQVKICLLLFMYVIKLSVIWYMGILYRFLELRDNIYQL